MTDEDRTGLREHHRYRLPNGHYAVAVRYWERGNASQDVPFAGWCLMDDEGVNHFVVRDGALTTFGAPADHWQVSDAVDMGAQPWCGQCDFGYDAGCPHTNNQP